MVWLAHWIVLQNAVFVELPHLTRDLGHCVNSNNIPQILPTTVHRGQTALKQMKCPFSVRSRTSRRGQDLRKTRERDVQQPYVNRDGNQCRRTRDKNSFSPWANVVFPNWKCEDNALWCMYEKKCAFACIWVGMGVYTPVALTADATGWVRNSDSATLQKKCDWDKTRHAVRLSGCWWQLWAFRFWVEWHPSPGCSYDIVKTRVPGCFTHHCSDHSSSCQLCWCHLCQVEDHEDELHQDVGDQLDEEDGWWCSSAKYSSQFMLSHSRYYCSEGSILLCKRFLSLTGIKEATCSLFSFCKFLNCSFASWYPGLCDRGGACLFSSTLRR